MTFARPWHKLLLLGVLATAAACSSYSAVDLRDDVDGGDSGGQGGAGGAMSFVDCSEDVVPSGGSCEPTDPTNLCQACVEVQCCELQEACNSTSPNTACAFGSTLFDGRTVDGGEIGCMMECFASRTSDKTFGGTQDDVDTCASECAASECKAPDASKTSQALAACIIGADSPENEGCAKECGFVP